MELGNYIMNILFTNPFVVMSWGFNTPVAIQDGLLFSVQGFLHKGKVSITLNGFDLFDIRLLNDDGSIKKEETDIYADNLTYIIDEMVEHCEDYDSKVKGEYKL